MLAIRRNRKARRAVAAFGLFLVLSSGCSAKDDDIVQLIVKFKETSTEAQRNSLNDQVGAQKLRTIYGDASAQVVKVSTKDMAQALKTYQQSGIVKYAEKDLKVSIPPNEK